MDSFTVSAWPDEFVIVDNSDDWVIYTTTDTQYTLVFNVVGLNDSAIAVAAAAAAAQSALDAAAAAASGMQAAMYDPQGIRNDAFARANHTGTQSADTLTDGVVNKAFLATERTKLAGIAVGATANQTDAFLLARANHTGTQSADTLTDGVTNKAFLATERTKLAGIAVGATANQTDAFLLSRANHTGTQSADTLTDGVTNKAFLATERTKLAGIAAGATANQTDAFLLARANHTGTEDDSVVNHVAPGTGGISLSVFNILKERIRAISYGVDPGNTAANNRLGIQQALNQVRANGGLVALPSFGDIPIDGTTINIPAGAMLEGQGDWSRLITNHASANIFDIAAQWSTIRDVYFAASVTRTGGYAVRYLAGGGRAQIKDFHIEGFQNGIYVGNTVSVRISHGRMLGFNAATGVGLRFDGGFDMKVNDILMDAAAQIFAGVYITAVGDLTMDKMQLIHAGQAIYVDTATGGGEVDSLWVTDSMLDNSTRGLYLQAGAGFIQRCKFIDTWFSSSLNQGVLIDATGAGKVDDVQFRGPHAYLNAASGMEINGANALNIRISDPSIGANGAAGVKFGAGVTKWSIGGGTIGKAGGFSTGNTTYGVDLSSGGQDFYQITGVDMRLNTSGAITGHTPGANKKLKLNLGAGSNDNGQEVGTATNDNAIAGNIGEYMESVVLSGAAVALVTATSKTITSITLTPGDWDIDGTVVILPANTTNVTQMAGSISATNNALDTTPGRYAEPPFPSAGFVYNGAKAPHIPTPTQRVSITANTTYYLVALASFTVSTCSAFGSIRARRVR